MRTQNKSQQNKNKGLFEILFLKDAYHTQNMGSECGQVWTLRLMRGKREKNLKIKWAYKNLTQESLGKAQ